MAYTEPHSKSLAAHAKKAGMSVKAFAESNVHTDSPVGKLARMYYIGGGTHGDGKSNMGDPGDRRSLGAKLYQVG